MITLFAPLIIEVAKMFAGNTSNTLDDSVVAIFEQINPLVARQAAIAAGVDINTPKSEWLAQIKARNAEWWAKLEAEADLGDAFRQKHGVLESGGRV